MGQYATRTALVQAFQSPFRMALYAHSQFDSTGKFELVVSYFDSAGTLSFPSFSAGVEKVE